MSGISTTRKRKVLSLEQKLTKSLDNRRYFSRCYDEIFIPHVKEYQQKTKKSGKMLLIIDNAPCHPSCELLDRENGLFKVVLLPPNTSSLKELLRRIVLSDADGDDLVSLLRNLSRDEVEQWLAVDDTPLFETLTDDEILEAMEIDENKDVDVSDMSAKSNEGPSHSEAYSCLKVSLK
ncbi:Jerky -like protein-like [Trichinella zimbabwensis]|uniref:Jerky-like protein-like n=1 Tax=Trichinella zimbabwensis TaxID=268475 RepID=A0A0V1HL56_9BILA|nr:Jerky -like protein-like [Trichinella zimbabwensis]